ncbi:hypothetical protein [Pseudomonas sp. SWI44]|uniref:hypothetical protein n=1 Tax=Pseudomonas sp. SWI44 TaxID=2083053 RepID=UPI003531B63D
MPLTKPNQELRRDLKEAASTLKWSGVDLFTFAKKLLAAGDEDGANQLMEISLRFQDVEDKLQGYAEEVKIGLISREKSSAIPSSASELEHKLIAENIEAITQKD